MKADLLMFSLLNCNKNYQRITQEKKPVVKHPPKLKNVTPKVKRKALAWKEHQ